MKVGVYTRIQEFLADVFEARQIYILIGAKYLPIDRDDRIIFHIDI